jgi:hypothetical protein
MATEDEREVIEEGERLLGKWIDQFVQDPSSEVRTKWVPHPETWAPCFITYEFDGRQVVFISVVIGRSERSAG